MFIFCFFCGLACYDRGAKTSIGKMPGFLIGFFFSLVGVLIVFLLPENEICHLCEFEKKKSDVYCPRCLRDVTGHTAQENIEKFRNK